MDDVGRLRGAFESGELLPPDPDVPNAVDLARAVASWAGADGIPGGAGVERIGSLIGEPDHLVFTVVDGLGIDLMERLPESSFLRRHLSLELRSVFPSTTAVGLTTYATGAWPSEHALTSWFVHLPEINDTVTILPYIRRSDSMSLDRLGVTPEQAFPTPSLHAGFKCDTLAVQPQDIVNSKYSKYWMAGRPGVGYRREEFDRAIEMVARRTSEEPSRSFTYLYVDFVDKAAHEAGTGADDVLRELERLDRAIGDLAASMGPGCRMVLSSDHGHLDFTPEAAHIIDEESSLRRLLRAPPAHDARVIFFHLRRGVAGQFREAFAGEHGEDFVLLSADEVESMGLLGPDPLSDQTRARIGDFVGISLGEPIIWYRQAAQEMRFRSLHSGLSPQEMRIPLVVV